MPRNYSRRRSSSKKAKRTTKKKSIRQPKSKKMRGGVTVKAQEEKMTKRQRIDEKESTKAKELYENLLQLRKKFDYERLEPLIEQLKEENEIRYGLKDYVAQPPDEKKIKIVAAKYVLYSRFEIPDDRNIEDAHSYWVKWDNLHVVWKKGEQAEIYEDGGCSESDENFKRPYDVFPGYEVVCVTEC